MYETHRRFSDKYYPTYRLFIGNKSLICIRHLDDLEIILSNSKLLKKVFGYEHMRPWLKNSLLLSEGNKWRQRRKILTPAFHFNILKKYNEITNDHGDKAVKNFLSKGDETTLDLLAFLTDYSLDILQQEFPWRLTAVEKNTELQREYHKNANYKHLISIENDENTVSGDIYLGQKKRLAMLDLLLAAEQTGSMDDDGIKEEVANFVFAGHDTTALSLIFTIILFAENKDVQVRARDEMVEIIN